MASTFALAAKEVLELVLQHLPFIISLVVGGAGGVVSCRFLRTNFIGNTDFKIVTEHTEVALSPAPAIGSLQVRVRRKFTLKLRDKNKKGTYQLRAELRGNNISGRWESGCQITLNGDGLSHHFEEDDSIIKSGQCKISSNDILTITLNSVETINKGRGFYALVVTNPKDETTMQWNLKDFAGNAPPVRACASSEDFDLRILRCGIKESISESSHQVTYFFAWAEELFL